MRYSARSANALRVLTFLTFGAAALLGIRTCSQTEPSRESVKPASGEVSVRDAVGRIKHVTIRGYLFNDLATRGYQLCDQRDPGKPPRCVGPAISLGPGFDANRFNLRSAKTTTGVTIVWADEPIVVSGTLDGGLFLKVDGIGG